MSERANGSCLMRTIDRRRILAAGTAACLAPAIAPAGAWADSGDDMPVKGDLLVAGDGEATTPLTADSVKIGADIVTAVAMTPKGVVKNGSRFSKLILFRFDSKDVAAEVRPMTVDGIMAFSAICTHQACELSAWEPAGDALRCFCHGSQFAPAMGGDVTHGPAVKRLPMLPLAKDGSGRLVVADGFTAPPGPPAKPKI